MGLVFSYTFSPIVLLRTLPTYIHFPTKTQAPKTKPHKKRKTQTYLWSSRKNGYRRWRHWCAAIARRYPPCAPPWWWVPAQTEPGFRQRPPARTSQTSRSIPRLQGMSLSVMILCLQWMMNDWSVIWRVWRFPRWTNSQMVWGDNGLARHDAKFLGLPWISSGNYGLQMGMPNKSVFVSQELSYLYINGRAFQPMDPWYRVVLLIKWKALMT